MARMTTKTIKKSARKNHSFLKIVVTLLLVALVLGAKQYLAYQNSASMADLPEYTGSPTMTIDHNQTSFTDEDYAKAQESYINLSSLDIQGRCGVAEMSVTKEDLPKEKRGDISNVKPSGWKQAFYPELIEMNQGALYNRCHLLMYALSGLNDDERNLITGTVYFNTEAMLLVENEVLNYVSKGNRVIYRVTPVFNGTELVARGVQIEVSDVATKGQTFSRNVYCYNVQPGIDIDYNTGNSALSGEPISTDVDSKEFIEELLNTILQN
jgi:DNA-entry nuclease